MTTEKLELIETSRLVPYANNARTHNPAQINQLRASLREFGFVNPILVDGQLNVIAGHGRLTAALAEGIPKVPCVFVEHLTESQKRAYILADNRLAELAGWDEELLKIELDALKEMDFDIGLIGFEDYEFNSDELSEWTGDKQGALAQRFLFPPFSILDTRKKEWQDRKNFWIKGIGIRSSETREGMKTLGALSGSTPRYYEFRAKCEQKLGHKLSNREFEENYLQDYLSKDSNIQSAQDGGMLSTFDPVLAELMYYWFCPARGTILDPFAGGNVRGAVAALTDHDYTGVDIRQEQVDANIKATAPLLGDKNPPHWICGDSVNIGSLVGGEFDMIFSCPPYFDLEQYSDNPDDLSNMEWEKFLECYRAIVAASVSKLKKNRFGVFVVGDVRDRKTGLYRNFVSETIAAFEASGAKLYNEIILITQAGSLPLRVGHNFKTMRKVGKSHQNVLVFYNGTNQKEIPRDFGEVEIAIPAEETFEQT